jgi:CRISPR/Cas system endoribonuclease Cas6 (RAMP superfamily)
MNLSIPLARYRFTAQMRDPVRLPDYAGSLLRGQFGAALRGVACMTRQPVCGGCPLLATCPYTRIFEAQPPPAHSLQKFSAIPNAYVIEPPPIGGKDLAGGDTLVFHMVLAGDALAQLALIVFAWQRALAQGLTRSRSAAELLTVEWIDVTGAAHPVWHRDVPVLIDHPAALVVPAAPAGSLNALTLHIQTPLRLQQQGQPLRVDQLTPHALLAALARRVALVMEFHAQQPEWGHAVPEQVRLAESLSDKRELHWHDWTRYSSRQQQEMTLGGVLGRWTLHGSNGALTALWPLLWLGQWLHVGKNATMGMGGYTLNGGSL